QNEYSEELGHPVFTNVSEALLNNHGGFGLGVAINDVNNDGLIDIYIANDFVTDDLLFVQKRHKDSILPWFEEKSKAYLSHSSYNSMGVDFNDINNDELPDILVVDMLPENPRRQKLMFGNMNYEKYLLGLNNTYNPQYVRNTLQVNNGEFNSNVIKTSEVGFLSNISSTDWSWSPLMVDLDNDGDKDIYITNGYIKDVADLDFINYSAHIKLFGTAKERENSQKEFAENLDSIYLPNYIFENSNSMKFKDVSKTWVAETPSFSNGVAYADLDLDGDLDIITNNLNQKAFLLKNTSEMDTTSHYLRFKLKGLPTNTNAIGAKISVWSKGSVQYQFQSVVKGYLSSVDPILHFGLKNTYVDSVKVTWPNNKISKLTSIATDQVLTLAIEDAKDEEYSQKRQSALFFEKEHNILDLNHQESHFNEFAIQGLLMKQYSAYGPCLAAANIDGKDGDEIFLGGSKGVRSSIWFQNDTGAYEVKQYLEDQFEDSDALFLDIDGDDDLDLFVTSGSSEYGKTSEFYQDRVYLNNGEGNFERSEDLEYSNQESSHFVRPIDIDKDGDLDLFVGSRISPGNYPAPIGSRILINTDGRFIDDDQPVLKDIGMVTDAIWDDIDADGWPDLMVVGEWMPILVLKNTKGKLETMPTTWYDEENVTKDTSGWWNTVEKLDYDKDGDMDFIFGNQGINNFYNPTRNQPLYLYKGDYDQNGSPDPILAMYDKSGNGKLIPVHSRDNVINQLPSLKKQFFSYEKYSTVGFTELLNIKDLSKETLQAATFESCYAENLGNGKFKIHPLPMECQLAPINDFLIQDYDNDGYEDVLVVGNDFSSEALFGKLDAFNGLLLHGSKNGFVSVPPKDSGFYVPGQSNHIIQFKNAKGKPYILAGQNKDSILVFSLNR
ncbi:MAG: VCBS repeat-containing protein, partial [Maribacter sp.]